MLDLVHCPVYQFAQVVPNVFVKHKLIELFGTILRKSASDFSLLSLPPVQLYAIPDQPKA